MGADYYKTMENGGRKAAAASRESERALSSISSQLNSVKSAAGGLAGAFAGAFATTQLIHYADTWTQLSSRLKLASASASDFSISQRALMDISQRTGTSLEANTNMFSRMAKAMQQLGYTASDTAKVTELVATTLRLSGAGASESASVITQFGQAMASGVLRGDEFNSIMENGGRFAQALADGLGVTIGQLRAMAMAGQLTTDRVMPALLGQLTQVRAEGETMGATVSASVQRIENAFLAWVGTANQASGVTAAIGGILDGLAEHMDGVATAAGALVAAGIVKTLGSWTSSTFAATKATIAAQREELALAAAQAKGATTARIRAEAAVKLAAAQREAAAGTEKATMALETQIKAQVRATEARAAEAAAASRFNSMTSVAGRLGSGLLSAVGGIPGIIMGIATAWAYVYEKNEQARQSALDYGKSLLDVKPPSGLSITAGADTEETITKTAVAMRVQQEEISSLNDDISRLTSKTDDYKRALQSAGEGSYAYNEAQEELSDIYDELHNKTERRDALLKTLKVTEDQHSLSLRESAAAANAYTNALLNMTGQGAAFKKTLDGINSSLQVNQEIAGAGPGPFRVKQAPVSAKDQDTLTQKQNSAELAGLTGLSRVRRQAQIDLQKMGKTGVENSTYIAQYTKAMEDEYNNTQKLAAASKAATAANREAKKEKTEAERATENYTRKMADLTTEIEVQKVRVDEGEKAARLYAASHENGAKFSEDQVKALRKEAEELEKWKIKADAATKTRQDQAEALKKLIEAKQKYDQDTNVSDNTRVMGSKQRDQYTQQQDIDRVYEQSDKGAEATKAHQDALEALDKKFKSMQAAEADWLSGAQQGLVDWVENASNYSQQAASAVKGAMDGLVNNITDMLNGNKASWKDWASSVLQSIEKILLNMAIVQGLKSLGNAMSGMGGAWGTFGTALASAAAAKGDVFSGPGIHAYSNSIVSRPTTFAFAKGAGLMGEAGPEAVMPLVRGSNGRLGVTSTGGGNNIVINSNVVINGDSSQSSSSGSNDDVGRAYQKTIDSSIQEGIRRELKPGGLIWNARQKR
ncbi:hypothetical protein SB5439_04984 [Klebsiella variicola]|nr:hypothetical protein SB5439_04984 [Klebsiella variicola]